MCNSLFFTKYDKYETVSHNTKTDSGTSMAKVTPHLLHATPQMGRVLHPRWEGSSTPEGEGPPPKLPSALLLRLHFLLHSQGWIPAQGVSCRSNCEAQLQVVWKGRESRKTSYLLRKSIGHNQVILMMCMTLQIVTAAAGVWPVQSLLWACVCHDKNSMTMKKE